ncbi:hypothetical protein F4604DRAFT_1677979 [Suillus subluteus]|nr:hypothetical protein F4604DRAFT_1677979 [Suillus subluteus]
MDGCSWMMGDAGRLSLRKRTRHARGNAAAAVGARASTPVPWKEVIPRQEELIPPPYLLEGRKIQELSRMNRNEATELLDFWYNRQQTCQDITFEFYGWWSKADKEVKPPVRSMSWLEDDKPGDGKRQKKLGGKGKTRKRPGQKSTAMVDDSSHSSEEDDVLTHRQKLLKKTAKKPHKSRSRVYSEESSDGFSAPDSSDKSSDDEMPTTGKGEALVKDKTGESGEGLECQNDRCCLMLLKQNRTIPW